MYETLEGEAPAEKMIAGYYATRMGLMSAAEAFEAKALGEAAAYHAALAASKPMPMLSALRKKGATIH